MRIENLIQSCLFFSYCIIKKKKSIFLKALKTLPIHISLAVTKTVRHSMGKAFILSGLGFRIENSIEEFHFFFPKQDVLTSKPLVRRTLKFVLSFWQQGRVDCEKDKEEARPLLFFPLPCHGSMFCYFHNWEKSQYQIGHSHPL